jgi:hypothetical protein
MALDMGGAAGGGEMLQQVLARKLQEQQVLAQQKFAQAKLAEEVRQADMQNQVQQGNLALGGRRVGLDEAQFTEGNKRYTDEAPLRAVGLRLHTAQAGELERKPQDEQAQRDFTMGRDKTQHGYQMQEIGAQGANQMRLLNARVAGAQAAKAPSADQQQNEVADTLALIDRIQSDPSMTHGVGPVDQYVGGVINGDVTGVNRFKSLHDQLVGKMSLAQAGKLKGQGQISDKERAMLASAATALNRGLSEKDYLTELQNVRGQFQRMQGGGGVVASPAAGGNLAAAQEYDYVPGKGLVPRGK